jgi:hypothetical protein
MLAGAYEYILFSYPSRTLVYCPHIYTPVVAPKMVCRLVFVILLHHSENTPSCVRGFSRKGFHVKICVSSFLVLISILIRTGIRATVVDCEIQSTRSTQFFGGVPCAALAIRFRCCQSTEIDCHGFRTCAASEIVPLFRVPQELLSSPSSLFGNPRSGLREGGVLDWTEAARSCEAISDQ